MSNELPSLGRNPLEPIRIISGTERQGSDYVADTAEFTKGYLGKQTVNSNGDVEWAVAGTGENVDGILNSHKANTFYKSVAVKPVEIDEDGDGNLTPYLKANSVLLTSTGGVAVTADYTINLTTGAISENSPSGVEKTIYASYQYDVREPGVDNTLGSGKVAVIRGVGEIETLVYDTSVAISNGLSVRSKAGIASTDIALVGAGKQIIGTVVRPPTADNPYLRIRVNL